MLVNYLLIALRTQRNQPGFTAIKVLSLALGLICTLLVLMHVQYIYSYDRHFDNWQNIYRISASITTDHRIDANVIADGQFTALQNDYSQIEIAARMMPDAALFSNGEVAASSNYLWVDPSFLEIFSFEFIAGDPSVPLAQPNTIVISRSAARRYFGDQPAVGQTLTWSNRVDMRVTGVFEDIPENTHFKTDAMMAISTAQGIVGERFLSSGSWISYGGLSAYLYIPDPLQAAALQQDLPSYVLRNVPEQEHDFVVNNRQLALAIEPVTRLHLSPRQGFGPSDYSRRYMIGGLLLFSVLILLSSCINFTNLSLAHMQQRTKEIGVRKSLGARQSDLLAQFLTEVLLLTMLAFLLALPVVYMVVPVYTAVTDTHFQFSSIWQSQYVWFVIATVILTGLLSGLMPAMRMSRYQPTQASKGGREGGNANRIKRAALAVVQFAFAVILLSLAAVISKQISHLSESDFGFNRSNLVVMHSMTGLTNVADVNFEAMVDSLLTHPAIETVAMAQALPPSESGYNAWQRRGGAGEEMISLSHLGVDERYVELMQLQILAGRNFSTNFPADFEPIGRRDDAHTYGVILAEAAVAALGFSSNQDALGKLLTLDSFTYRVVGVVNNFQLSGGLTDPGRSIAVLRARSRPMLALMVRIDPDQSDAALAHIDEVWALHRPNAPINRQFYETSFNQSIHDETNAISMAARFAAFVTFVIAVLGLYALAYYSTVRRTKEIGVRKVLGASVRSIHRLLVVGFIKPVLLACILGSVVAWYLAEFYLNQFSSRIGVSGFMFLGIASVTILLAILAVTVQCYSTARADPVQSLRAE